MHGRGATRARLAHRAAQKRRYDRHRGPVSLLDELIERYGKDAVVTVDPYMPDSSGEILRWVLQIDGMEVSDVDVRIGEHPKHRDVMVMLLVHGGEEVELTRWHEDAESPGSIKAGARYYGGGSRVVETLGGLRRRQSR